MTTVTVTARLGVCILHLVFSSVILSSFLRASDAALVCKKCDYLKENEYPDTSWAYMVSQLPECGATYTKQCTGGGGGSVSGDPHFVGAHGTRYDFNGRPGKDYCLFTDSSVHMNFMLNMHMIGYDVNDRKTGGGKAVRTWIGKLGIMWKVGGESHSLLLSAREGPQVERGSGFLAGAELDGVALPTLGEGEAHALVGGGNLTFHHIGSWGHRKDPVEVYVITLPAELLTIRLALRVEDRRWRTRSNSWTHLDVSLSRVHPSGKVHGVLGQTYKTDRGSRSMDFKSLTSLLRRPVAADGPSGAGFLDGSAADYETSGVLAADCRFSAFNQAD